jgi:saccharopine dehydrogenase-like NADP-dependent oxidoreductase
MHPKIAKVAIDSKTHMIDLGGNTEITMQTLALDEEAKAADVTLVPDCGLAPGLVNSLGCSLIEQLDEVIRKEDYRFRHEPRSEAERTAPARAISWAAGADGLS